MNSLVFSLMAGGCTSLASLFFRKSSDPKAQASPTSYLAMFYLLSFLLSILFYPSIWKSEVNFVVLSIGIAVGLLNASLMMLTSRALKAGPAGLTFAFQNASAVFPGLILFTLLGSEYGFTCSPLQLLGMALVLIGLFLGANKTPTNQPKASFKWLKFAFACFFVQILALTLIQARCLLPNFGFQMSEADDVWFMPGFFGIALLVQFVLFLKEKKEVQSRQILFGCFGGITNFLSTGLLLLATKWALPFEKGILFPCFAVAAMILCNVWANRLYKEDFNLKTNILCSFGIFMAVAG